MEQTTLNYAASLWFRDRIAVNLAVIIAKNAYTDPTWQNKLNALEFRVINYNTTGKNKKSLILYSSDGIDGISIIPGPSHENNILAKALIKRINTLIDQQLKMEITQLHVNN